MYSTGRLWVVNGLFFHGGMEWGRLLAESTLNQAATLRPSRRQPVQDDAWAYSVAKRLSDKSLHCRLNSSAILFLLRVYRIVHALSQTVSKILFISMFYKKIWKIWVKSCISKTTLMFKASLVLWQWVWSVDLKPKTTLGFGDPPILPNYTKSVFL